MCGTNGSCQVPKCSARSYGRGYLHNRLSCFSLTHTHPLTDFSCLLSGPCSRVVCPGLCGCDAEDEGCWLSDVSLEFSLAGDNDIRQLFPACWESTIVWGFPWLCSPSWQAGRRGSGVCGAPSSRRGAVSSAAWLVLWPCRSPVLQAGWELPLPELG